jgi:hypothetical protein
MRREDRFRLLRICTAAHPEGEPIANVDFSQLFPRLAYHLIKQEPPDGDLYDLGGGVSTSATSVSGVGFFFARGGLTGFSVLARSSHAAASAGRYMASVEIDF